MAKSEQAKLIGSLLGKGYSVKDIASLTGRSSRYITLARDSESKVGKGGKVASGRGQNLIPALKELNERGKLSPASMPERRKTKAGKTAKVRKGVEKVTSKSGRQHTAARVKNGPATLKRAIGKAASNGAGLRWDINFKNAKTISDAKKKNVWVSGQLPAGWTAQTLLDRISSPQEGDNWKPGDVNGALATLAIEQSTGIVSASGPQDFSLFSTDS